MNIGLHSDDLREITAIFDEFAAIEEVIVFGSRAKGNYHPGSDLDLAVKGENFGFNQFMELLVRLGKPGFLFKIDLVNHNTIDSQELIEHIARVGVRTYSKAPVHSPEIR